MTKRKISHSQIVLWRSCEQRWEYRYGQRLVPNRIERPLHIGTWVHALLEAHYNGTGWRKAHAAFTKQYDKMFDEEKQRLDRGKSKAKEGTVFEPLPSQIERIMLSYLWYYRRSVERVIATEVKFELDMGDYILHGIIDEIYEDEDGLRWVRDHKIWDEIPDEKAYHTMDPQLTIYLRGAREALGVQAAGVEYNYVRSAAPTLPSKNKDGSISQKEIASDYPTLFRWLTQNGYDPREYTGLLEPLAETSPFLRRYKLPRADLVTDRIIADADRTAREILDHESPIRNISRDCNWCPYAVLCRADLFGIDTTYIRENSFRIEKKDERGKLPVVASAGG